MEELFAKSPDSTPFLSVDWLQSWWNYFSDGHKLCILILKEKDKLIGIAPFAIFRRGPLRIVKFIGTGLADYLNFLLLGDFEKRVKYLRQIFSYLLEEVPHWNIIELMDIPAESNNVKALQKILVENRLSYSLKISYPCPFLPINSSWETFLQTKSKKSRYNLRRFLRKLEEIGEVHFQTYREPQQVATMLAKAYNVHEKRWEKQYTGTSFSSSSITEAFFSEIAERYAQRGWFELTTLEIDEKLVAFSYSFIYRGRFYYYIPSYDPQFYEYSPGTVLLTYLLEDAFNRGLKEFDFTRGDEEYKSKWAQQERKNLRIIISNKGYIDRLVYYGYLVHLFLWQKASHSSLLKRIRRRVLGQVQYFLQKVTGRGS